MSETARDVVTRWTEDVWNSGRLELIPELVADPCPRHDPGKLELLTLEANIGRVTGARARLPDIHFTNDDLIVEGDRVVARYTMRFTNPETKEPVVMAGIEIFRVSGGKIVETWNTPPGRAAWG